MKTWQIIALVVVVVVAFAGADLGWLGHKAQAAVQMSWRTENGWTFSYDTDPLSANSFVNVSVPCSQGYDQMTIVSGSIASRDLAMKMASYHDHPTPLENLTSVKIKDGSELYRKGIWFYSGHRCSRGHMHDATYLGSCDSEETARLILNLLR